MKKILKQFTLLSLLLLTIISCVDEDKFVNPVHFNLENGSFIKFSNQAPIVVSLEDPATAIFSEEIIDANNNTDTYSLTMTAQTNGTSYTVEDFIFVDSFPSTLTISPQKIADAVGIDITDITFGDKFNFVASTVRNDGVIYSEANTEGTLNASPGYKSAMKFSFLYGCPGILTTDDLVGQWQITKDDFGVVLDNGVFDIIAGPGQNQVTLVDPFDHTNLSTGERFDVIMNFDPNASTGSFSKQDSWDSGAYNLTYGIGRIEGEGLILSCIDNGFMSFTFEYTVDIGSFGSFTMEMTKL